MKSFLVIVFGLYSFFLNGGNIQAQSIGIMGGRSVMPADYFSLRYTHYSNLPINGAIGVFTEHSRTNGLNYSSYGLDVLGEFASNQNDPTVFALRIGIGGTLLFEKEPWIYNNLSINQRLNYGLIGELTGEWWMSENFCLSVFNQQKILFQKPLGSSRFVFGIGLKMMLGDF